jgi:hypothetical protein
MKARLLMWEQEGKKETQKGVICNYVFHQQDAFQLYFFKNRVVTAHETKIDAIKKTTPYLSNIPAICDRPGQFP